MKIFNLKKYVSVLVILLLVDCALGSYLGVWRDPYWQSISNKDFYHWMFLIGQFCGIALLSCFISGYSQYIGSIIALRMRTELTKKAFLSEHHLIEGGSQRVQEDCMTYPTLLIQLSTSFMRSMIMIIAFSIIILIHLKWYYLLIPFIYSLVGTLLAGKIARPLISLNYLRQVVEAKFRQGLNKNNYIKVHDNNFYLFKQTKYLQYFQSFYNQITVIFPHLILAFLYFTSKITFGVFMQIAASMAEITDSLSIVINSFSDINNFLSCRKRLKELGVI